MIPLPIKPTRHDVYEFISPTVGTKDAVVGKAVLVTGAGSGIGEVRTPLSDSPSQQYIGFSFITDF